MANILAVVLETMAELPAILLNTLPVLYLVLTMIYFTLIFTRTIASRY